jgi:hypothetical protein
VTVTGFLLPSAKRAVSVALLAWAAAVPAAAQHFPDGPVVLGNGRVTIGGDASLTFSCAGDPDPEQPTCSDDTGFFNYTDYDHSTLRELRLNVSASIRANQHVAVLTEFRSLNGSQPMPYALYVRLRPWERRAFDVQIGRLPPTFGASARRGYPNENFLISYPLGYQYLTSLRADAIPADGDELLRMRGRGWLSQFTKGNTTPDAGLPIAQAFRWDTGVQVHAAGSFADVTASVTTGSLGNPLVVDDNAGKQFAGRVAVHPHPSLIVGVSGARGPFLTRDATGSLNADTDNSRFVQRALGIDAEYSREYLLIRAEGIFSRWTLPTLDKPLDATAASLEGRYKIRPPFYVAARLDRLTFSTFSTPTRSAAWEAPVTRVEAGGGYRLRRNLLLKASFQRNVRNGGRVPRLNIGAMQLVFWL